ncbi:hypothetical protein GCM10010106_12310 [Thermopolyspora flexuosa]|uniref:V8-like Glu-specific endopeptidase n=1 Tax=Thermopolyspora flexuosa TaxID=103836 RepID=A0A543J0Y5_9ACTN|nr:trypsin-like peptidase domain-containing protein [Thermopolyspora flexuosa]TQM76482.1 V8-like Glu-specific endopeptidase [Thermopolyspora flexuosa]GGM67860.1 hypothetical protein GCM10010106_12310 [Thermopolyspora flexuosa]
MTACLPLMAAGCLAAVLVGPITGGPSPVTRPSPAGPPHVRPAAPARLAGPGEVEAVSLESAPAGPSPARALRAPAGGSGGDAPGAAPPGPGRPGVVQHAAEADGAAQRRVLAYWTPGRMAAAEPVEPSGGFGNLLPPERRRQATASGVGLAHATAGARWTMASGRRPAAPGTIAATTGRVFLTMNGRDFVCSAVSIRAANRDLVLTAGHCVKDGTGDWARNWTFVPGYDSGRRPYGTYTARRAFVTTGWSRHGDDDEDVAMVAVNPHGGRHLADVVGAQPIGFNPPRGRQTYAFGFPAYPPYNGEHLMYCAGPLHADPNRQTRGQGLRCDLTAGASGGPWLSGFDPVTGHGTVTSVSSFKYSNDRHTMYGPYFGDAIRRLHAVAERS